MNPSCSSDHHMLPEDLGPLDLTHHNTLALPCHALHAYQLEHPEQAATETKAILNRHPQHRPFILGGGSNLILPQQLPLVIQPAMRGIDYLGLQGQHHHYRALAATPWHELVCHTVQQDHPGLENLALIPGHCGAAPVQNIGAYGTELAEFLHAVEGVQLPDCTPFRHDRQQGHYRYRDSLYKRETGRWLITAIELALPDNWQARTDYPGLEKLLTNKAKTAENILAAVVELRQRKLPDPHTTPNAGSFFKNPVVDEFHMRELHLQYPDLPHWPVEQGHKLSAAWLIEQSGWKGRALGPAAVSKQHALVLINRGGASQRDLLKLAQAIQGDVHQQFGVRLEIEPQQPTC